MSSRRGIARIATLPVAVLAFAAALALAGCDQRGSASALSGTVVDAAESLTAPRLEVPTVVPAPRAQARSTEATIATLTRLGDKALVASIPVEVGQEVAVGDPVAVFDDAGLRIEARRQRAQLKLGQARVRLLDETLDDIEDKQAEVADARRQVASTIAELESSLASLRATRAGAVGSLSRLEAVMARLRGARPPGLPRPGMPRPPSPPGSGDSPTGTPTGTPSPTPTSSLVPTGTIAPPAPRIPPMPRLPDPGAIRAGIGRLDAGIAKLTTGLGQARSGLARLESAAADLAEAKATVEDLRTLAAIAAEAQDVAVGLAEARSEDAVVRALTAGRVVEAADVGDVLAPGATVAIIAPRTPARVSTWVPMDAIGEVRVGMPAEVWTDTSPNRRLAARVVRIGEEAVYPPTRYATREVHLLRSVEVEVEVTDAAVELASGTPATVAITGMSDVRGARETR